MRKLHFKSIAEQNDAFGIRPPEHPLIDVIKLASVSPESELACQDELSLSTEFYSVSIKQITSGEILYGRTQYDCSNGTMIFLAPNQLFSTLGIKVESVARAICFHPDFLCGHPLKEQLKRYHFFSYAVNEALHLAPREQQQMGLLFDAIEAEYHNSYDAFTRELILSQLSTILQYADRFYHRQFLMRKESAASVFERFMPLLDAHLDKVQAGAEQIPDIESLASPMNMSGRYLSDALKAETGKTTKDWIHLALIDRSKDLLLATDKSIASIAYHLGFEYPQYFSRLFKSKVGITPTAYREEKGIH